MAFPKVFDVILGLVLFYFILSLPVSIISQMLMGSAEIRGTLYQQFLRRIVGDKLNELINLPEVKSLRPIRFKTWTGVFGANTEPKMLENIPVPVLVDSVFRVMGLANKKKINRNDLDRIVNEMPNSETKNTFRIWIDEGTTKIDDLRQKLSSYFSTLTDQVDATTKAHSRSIVIILSMMIVLTIGVDSFQLAKDLSVDTELRKGIILEQVKSTLEKNGPDADLSVYFQKADNPTITIGWWQIRDSFPQSTTAYDWVSFTLLKLLGLAITAVAVSPGIGFWFDVFQKLRK